VTVRVVDISTATAFAGYRGADPPSPHRHDRQRARGLRPLRWPSSRPTTGGYVTRPGATRGVPAAGGRWCWLVWSGWPCQDVRVAPCVGFLSSRL